MFAKIYIRHKKETKTIPVSELYDRDDNDHSIPFDTKTFDENRLYFVRECEKKCKVNHKHYRSVQVFRVRKTKKAAERAPKVRDRIGNSKYRSSSDCLDSDTESSEFSENENENELIIREDEETGAEPSDLELEQTAPIENKKKKEKG